jgi:mannosyltransferase
MTKLLKTGPAHPLQTIPPLILALLAVLSAIAIRAWTLVMPPLWLDEAYSAFAADHGFGFLWHVVPRYETHPPLYYTILHLWSDAFGRSLLSRRALGLVCGLGSVAVLGLAADRLGRLTGRDIVARRWLAAMVLALAAFQPLMVDMTQQVRPYPVMTLAYAIGIYALLRLAEDGAARRPPGRPWIALFFVAQALVLWLHSLGPLFGLSTFVALLIVVPRRGLNRADWAWLVGGQVLTGLIYLPALAILASQAPTWVKSTWLQFEPAGVPDEVSYIYLNWNYWSRLIGLATAVAGVAVLVRRRCGRIAGGLLVLGLLPVALSILLSATVSPVFLTRTLSAATVPALLLIGYGLVWRGFWQYAALPVLLVLIAPMLSVDKLHAGRPLQNWYGAIAWLAPQVSPGDTVWTYPNEVALPLAYALRDEGRRLPLLSVPAPVPAFASGGFNPSGSRGVVSLYPGQIDRLMTTPYAKAPPTIWLVRLVSGLYDPNDAMPAALERDRIAIARFHDGDIDIIGLRRRDLPRVATPQQPQP